MPHVIIKALPGKTAAQKQQIADAITRSVSEIFGNEPDAISVALEDVSAERWKDDVYVPDIVGRADTLLKPPGYQL
ncbi:tautomerase family protein [Actomonas aquatica]|uniref:Tautomerase family protein n=1 Tax=Actomonas aquatica TaxID=2866162 RepID=A0ABZ1C7Q3_9BACT|nr:tautomerase family protein [Opitutus sp. WL0086]WRQ87619.1 tautomerase family protein [Opitutus sp. WL0086]